MAPVLTDLKQKSSSAKANPAARQTLQPATPPPPSIQASHAAPLGATIQRGGVDFSLFSRKASGVDLLLFDHEDDPRPAQIIPINPETNLTYHYWHIFVPNIQPGQIYAYRVNGPIDPANGLRFDPSKVLLDPYGFGVVVPKNYSRDAASQPGDNTATAMKSVVVDPAAYDWEGDTPLNRSSTKTVVYEMHVRGFTRHPSSGVPSEISGTYRGLIEKIPYLQQLGVTAVELLPIFQFDAQDCPPGLVNYWGYQPVSYFSPHRASARVRTLSAPPMSSAIWSKLSIVQESRSSLTLSSITPPKAITPAQLFVFAESITVPTTSSIEIPRVIWTSVAVATHSTPITPSSAA